MTAMTLALASTLPLAWHLPSALHAQPRRPIRSCVTCLEGDAPPPDPLKKQSIADALAAADAKLDEARQEQVGSSWQELGQPTR